MNQQLDLFPLDRDALETELKDREGLFWLFMVYFPKQRYYRPDATKRQREKAEKQGRRPIPQNHWNRAMQNAERIEEIRQTLNWIGKSS